MKKVISLFLALTLVFSMMTSVFALRFGMVEKNEAETLRISKNQGDYTIVSDNRFSGGSAVELKVTKYDEWLKNDYIRFAVPINQRANYNIKVGVKKGPDQGIAQLWFSDFNARVGDKIDLYSPTEEVTEINIADIPVNVQYTGRWFEFRADGKNPASKGANITIDYITLTFVSEYVAEGAEIPYLDGKAPVAYGDEPYVWGQVMEGGTGASTHVVFHPLEKGLVYLGTDMGGLYRWNDDTYTWTPLFDTIITNEKTPWLGVDGLALDPKNADIVYAAVGTKYSKKNHEGTVLKSYDRGNSWVETGFTAWFGANDDWRDTNETIAVDPANSDIVWVATLTPSLVKSNDGFKTWEEVSLPVELTKGKVFPRVVAFDHTTQTATGCERIYVGVYGLGLLVSNDRGETWEVVADCPVNNICSMEFSEDGTMIVSSNAAGGLWKYKDNVWTNISPMQDRKFKHVAISWKNSDYMVTNITGGPVGTYGEYVYVTTDGGKNWKLINDNATRVHIIPRLEYGCFWAHINDIAMDPFDEKRVFMAGQSNFYMTENILEENTVWKNPLRGIEHGCTTNITALPVGARFIVAAYDYEGGRFTDPTQYCDEMLPAKEVNPPRNDFCESNPNFIVRVGKSQGVYSTDNGMNWRSLEGYPEEIASKEIVGVAVSSDVYPETGKPAILITAHGFPPFVTFDLGKTWTKSACGNIRGDKWDRGNRVDSDSKHPEVFYALTVDALWRSDDFGITFNKITEFSAGKENADAIKRSFGKNSGIFVSASGKFYRSATKGELFKEIGDFTWIRDFAFGKEKDENSPATIYVFGTRNDILGIHRSTDNGETWEVIYNDETAKEKLVLTMVMGADRQTFGIVYVGSSGRGIKYGIPRDAENIFYSNKDDAIKVMINNQLEIFDVEPQLINDRTMVPMRKVFEDVGAKVDWDDATQTVTATRIVSDNYGIDKTTVQLTIGSNKIKINGAEKEMDIAPVVVNGRTLVPVRFISEALGAKVEWIDEKQLVKIVI